MMMVLVDDAVLCPVLSSQVIDPPGSQYMMLVMEFLEKGPVLQTNNQSGFGRLPEEVAADFFRQAVAGLEYLHFHKVRTGVVGWGLGWVVLCVLAAAGPLQRGGPA